MSVLSALRSGIGWGAISLLISTAVQLIYMAVMARLLDPADFGLLAMAGLVMRFLGYFAQLGVMPAIIQKPTLERSDIGAAITVSLVASLMCFLLVALLAPVFALIFDQPSLHLIIPALAFNFVLVGVSAVPMGLLRRGFAFKRVAQIDMAAYILGYCVVGLLLAAWGTGVWSLVGATLGQSLVTVLLSLAANRSEMSMRHAAADRAFFIRFGKKYSATGFLEFLTANLDAFLISKLMGSAPSGIYNRASLLANLPVQQPVNILTNSLYPVFSSIASQAEKMTQGIQLSLLTVGAFSGMVSLCIRIASPEIVGVLLGPKWSEAVPVLQVLSLSVTPNFVNHVIGVTLDSLAELRPRMVIQLLSLLSLCGLLWIGVGHGLIGIAWAVVANELLRMVMLLAVATRRLRVSTGELMRIASAVAVMVVSCGFVFKGLRSLALNHLEALPLLCLDVPCGLVAVCIAMLPALPIVRHIDSFRRAAAHAPQQLHRWLRAIPPNLPATPPHADIP